MTACALALSALTLSGCADKGVAMTVDGEDVAAGVYIIYSGYALSDAEDKFKEENPDTDVTAEGFDYYAQTVSGMDFADYVKQEAENYCKRHIAVQKMYEELGIELDAAEKDDITDAVNGQWYYDVSDWQSSFEYLGKCKTMGEYYESIGVAKSSLKEVVTVSYMADGIFKHYYGEGGTEEVPKTEITRYIDGNYSLVRYFALSITDDDGNVIEGKTELALIEKQAQEYVDMLNGGDAYKDVYARYEAAEGGDDLVSVEVEGEEEGDPEDEESDEPVYAEEGVEDSDYDRVINIDATTPSEEFVEALFAQEKNTAVIFKADTFYYVVQRLDITENEEYIEDYTETALNALRGDDMDDAIKNVYSGYSYTVNASAPDYAKEQAQNARDGLYTISQIQYYYSYYGSLFGG